LSERIHDPTVLALREYADPEKVREVAFPAEEAVPGESPGSVLVKINVAPLL